MTKSAEGSLQDDPNNPCVFDSGLPRWLRDHESTCNTGDIGSIHGSGRSPGGGNGNPLQYCAWQIPWTDEPGQGRGQETNLASFAFSQGHQDTPQSLPCIKYRRRQERTMDPWHQWEVGEGGSPSPALPTLDDPKCAMKVSMPSSMPL